MLNDSNCTTILCLAGSLVSAGLKKIIIDLPPVTSSVETLRIGQWVDGVACVICSGRTRTEVAQEALAKLTYAKTNILGVVLNRKQFFIPERIYGAL